MSIHSELKSWRDELRSAEDHELDGLEYAYYEGIDHIIKEFDCFGGDGDGGITETYIRGIMDALEKLQLIYNGLT